MKKLVSKKVFSGFGVDVRNGYPLTLIVPRSSRSETMGMGVNAKSRAKRLRDHDNSRAHVLSGNFGHQLCNRLVTNARQVSQKLSLAHEEAPEHFGKSESPQRMADV